MDLKLQEKLEKQNKLQPTPIISVTANFDEQICFHSGMDDYISKPIKFEKLTKVLSKYCKHKFNIIKHQ